MGDAMDTIMEDTESPLQLTDLIDFTTAPRLRNPNKQIIPRPTSPTPEQRRRGLYIAQIASGTADALHEATIGKRKSNITPKQVRALSRIAATMTLPFSLNSCEYALFARQVNTETYAIAIEIGVPPQVARSFCGGFAGKMERAMVAWDEYLVRVEERKRKAEDDRREKRKREERREEIRRKFGGFRL